MHKVAHETTENLTFSRISISASDSSSQRSKSGTRKTGFRSCAVSLSHQPRCSFRTVIFTCRCVDLWLTWTHGFIWWAQAAKVIEEQYTSRSDFLNGYIPLALLVKRIPSWTHTHFVLLHHGPGLQTKYHVKCKKSWTFKNIFIVKWIWNVSHL